MKKLIIIIVLLFSTLFSNVPFASAADLSHKQMSEIYGQGYHNALLETVVEVNAKASTRLEDNRNLLTQYYDDTKSYINERIKAYGEVSNFGELLIEQASGAMTLADTVLDLITSFFDEEGGEGSPVPVSCKMSTNDNGVDYWSASLPTSSYHICKVQIVWKEGTSYLERGHTLVATYTSSRMTFTLNMNGLIKTKYSTTYMPKSAPSSIGEFDAILRQAFDGKAWIEYDGQPFQQEKIEPKFFKNSFSNYRDNPTSRQPVYIPQLQPKLSCPDGDKIVQIDGRGGFVHANGVPVNTSDCTVYWQKPTVTVDDDGKVLLTDPDTGETIDTGVKPPKDKIPVEDKGEGCDSVLCFLGAVTSGIADLISSILGIVEEILDALLALFVPDNLDFVSVEFEKLSGKLNEKFSLLTGLKDTINGVFSSGNGGNPLSDVNMSLPAAPGTNFSLDTVSFIEPFVPRIKQIISGILFLMTIIYVYRKITGRGGVMEK